MPPLQNLRAAQKAKKFLYPLLFFGGLAMIVCYNGRLWRKDKALMLEKGQPRPLPSLEAWPDLPPVSVLVAAWNEMQHIVPHIRSFLRLRYPHKELVLCAGGEDGTYELARAYAGRYVKLLRQYPGQGKQGALARALPHATASIIFLTDADCLLDDESFEHTLYPLVAEGEQVCSGSSRPGQDQIADPFVVVQASSQLYSSLRTPRYAPGLLGRNCAVKRDLLEASRALEAHALTGTDYVLAKILAEAGARIRQVPGSRVVTCYPNTINEYLRQQRRWLRNVFTHGRRFGAQDEILASLRTSLIGLGMLLLPLAGIIAPGFLFVWLLLLWHAWLSRLRYLHVGNSILGSPLRIRQIGLLLYLLFLDFSAWSLCSLDYFSPRRQRDW